MSELRHGSGSFRARVRDLCGRLPSMPQVRVAEALNVISPTKADNGWRQYTDADVRGMAEWMKTQRPGTRSGKKVSSRRAGK